MPTDFSDHADQALESALQLAKRYDARITLLHIIILFPNDLDNAYSFEVYEELLRKRERQVERMFEPYIERVRGEKIEIVSQILHGASPADVLLDYLEEYAFDLVMMGSRGKTALKDSALGSVAEQTVQGSPAHVCTCQARQAPEIKKILVPIDFSLYAQKALLYAGSLAEKYGARVSLLHIIEQEIVPSFYEEDARERFESDDSLIQMVTDELIDFSEGALDSQQIESFEVRRGLAYKEIISFVEENPVDLLIIPSHGLNDVAYLKLGGTAEKVIRWAKCSLVALRRTA